MPSPCSQVPPEDQPDDRDILDAPLSWASKIMIDRVTFLARYPGGMKRVRYKVRAFTLRDGHMMRVSSDGICPLRCDTTWCP